MSEALACKYNLLSCASRVTCSQTLNKADATPFLQQLSISGTLLLAKKEDDGLLVKGCLLIPAVSRLDCNVGQIGSPIWWLQGWHLFSSSRVE